jgi:L-threonylcarbamoyladenylate synthase
MSIIEIENAVKLLRKNEVVAIATETVYGLAANAASDVAVAKIYALKNRPQFNPLIIHVASLEQAQEIALFNDAALALAKKHWPGALTLVLPKRDTSQFLLASAGLDTIAIRVPAHPIAQQILQQSGLMLAAPSANVSGRLSPTKAEHVLADFPELPIVDGGQCEVGLESTIIGFDGEQPVLLREGVLQIEGAIKSTSDKITAPGQLLKHYSPKNPIRINAKAPKEGEVFLGFGEIDGDLNLSKSGDLTEAAANLFAMLHELDLRGMPLAVAPVPVMGVGVAIFDRIARAANT